MFAKYSCRRAAYIICKIHYEKNILQNSEVALCITYFAECTPPDTVRGVFYYQLIRKGCQEWISSVDNLPPCPPPSWQFIPCIKSIFLVLNWTAHRTALHCLGIISSGDLISDCLTNQSKIDMWRLRICVCFVGLLWWICLFPYATPISFGPYQFCIQPLFKRPQRINVYFHPAYEGPFSAM